ncbi:hypothetical protein [Clostridium beijerinckii]|uniref:hypothetical protein n=1 Tax=Clostridium beijerinckii TaxID=1520 RepID=UPI0009914C3F|nr:hypothetical protein [Clostridium beijerinckii]
MKKKFFSLKFKTGLIFTILILMVLLINAIATIKQIKGINEESYGREALSVIKTINCNIDGDKFEELVKTKNDKTQYYEELRRKLSDIKKTVDAKYIYTMSKVEQDKFIYIVDGNDINSEEFSSIGKEEDISDYDEKVKLAMNQGKEDFSNLEYTTEYGYLISGVTPILNSSGKVVGLIGCDFEPKNIEKTQNMYIKQNMIISATFILISSILIIIITGRLLNNIKILLHKIDKITNLNLSSNTKEIKTKDEIGLIDTSIEEMRKSLNNLIHNINTESNTIENIVVNVKNNINKLDNDVEEV